MADETSKPKRRVPPPRVVAAALIKAALLEKRDHGLDVDAVYRAFGLGRPRAARHAKVMAQYDKLTKKLMATADGYIDRYENPPARKARAQPPEPPRP